MQDFIKTPGKHLNKMKSKYPVFVDTVDSKQVKKGEETREGGVACHLQ